MVTYVVIGLDVLAALLYTRVYFQKKKKTVSRKKIRRTANKIYIEKNIIDIRSTKEFFAGCKDEAELRKKYLSLCKIYHPDAGGDEAIFCMMQQEYDRRIG